MSRMAVHIIALISLFFFSCKDQRSDDFNSSDDIAALKDGKNIVVDVRTIQEWNEDGHASCAVHIPLAELSSHIDTLRNFENVFLVCRSGKRAEKAKEILEASGLNNAVNMGSWASFNCP